ncbi:outer membrane protein assembly factor BamC [Halofilum ochraceum]|uniref:outer membrane protein assembly factor BamC n=1 Tax=Halofilum ochraceum TaxID=1611323 RepID=UPI00082EE60E|nr:outer membrane protein assembly factor BamC [Halofilum ochraceum]
MRCNRLTRLPAGSLLVVTLLLGGCSLTADEGPTVDYRDAESAKSLEVPPDLTGPDSRAGLSVDGGATGDSTMASTGTSSTGTSGVGSGLDGSGQAGVLPEFDNVRFVRAGASSWLEVDNAAPDAVWPRAERFIRAQGLTIERREPTLGVIETDWAERLDGPESGGLTGFLSDALGGLTSENLRDRYNLRLERMDDGGTRIFVTHHLAQEIDAEADTRREADFEWVRRRGDPSVEAEMARRLLVYLGVSEERSETIVADAGEPLEGAVRYQQDDGVAWVVVDDPDPRRVFVRVGDALARIGADIRSSEREQRVYVFDWQPPEGAVDSGGLFGFFGDDEPETRRLQLQLAREAGRTEIRAADEGGEPRSGDVHRALLREVAVAMGADEALVRGDGDGDGGDTGRSGGGGYQEPERPPM